MSIFSKGRRELHWAMSTSSKVRLLKLVAVATVIFSCTRTIAVFDQHAYENATSLKAEALALMDEATTPFSQLDAEVKDLMVRVDAAYEYARGLPENEITAEQWEILKALDGSLLGGFFALWAQQGTVSAAGIAASKSNVAAAFDTIIELEAAKIK